MHKELDLSKGLKFQCTQCGYCCRHEPGYVFLTLEDLENLLKETSLERDEFLNKYCRTVDTGFDKRVSLIEKENNDCIFWEENGCSVYNGRPLQCRTYPFWSSVVYSQDTWKEESSHCPGINQGRLYSQEEIKELLSLREKQDIIHY